MVVFDYLVTNRNFGFADSPNVWAILCGSAAFLSISSQIAFRGFKNGREIALAFFCISIFMEVELASTFSRGGWIAYVMALIYVATTRVSIQRIILLHILLFIFIIILYPSGFNRALTLSQSYDDQSIHHRVIVWEDTLVLIFDNPLGLKTDSYQSVYSLWYQDEWRGEIYQNTICTYLTIAANRGIIIFGLTIFLLIFISICLYKLAKLASNFLSLLLISCLTFNMLSLIFTSYLTSTLILILWSILLTMSTIYIIIKRNIIINKSSICVHSLCIAISIELSVYFSGLLLASNYPIHKEIIDKNGGNQYIVENIFPRYGIPKDIQMTLCSDRLESVMIREIARPLALKRYEVFVLPNMPFEEYYHINNNIIKNSPSYKKVLVGFGSAGTAAILLGIMNKNAIVVSVNPQIFSPNNLNSLDDKLFQIKIPSLIIFTKRTNIDEEISTCKKAALINPNITVLTVDMNAGDNLTPIALILDKYISKHI